jgi:hypothetical protein
MQKLIVEITQTIAIEYLRIKQIPHETFSAKPSAAKWSKKEILGHLIDSCQNNIRRMIVARYDDTPNIVYHQDFWVDAAGYQNYSKDDVVELWYLLNKHFIHILNHLPEDDRTDLCDIGKGSPEVRTLEWIATDYLRHLQHHLQQI